MATYLLEHNPWESLDTDLPEYANFATQGKYRSTKPWCGSFGVTWDEPDDNLSFLSVDRFDTADGAQTALSQQNYDGPKYHTEDVGTHLEGATQADGGGYATAVYVRDCLLLVARWSYSFPDESTPEERDAQILPFLEPLAAEVCSAPDT